jgi:chromosome partitioning protein
MMTTIALLNQKGGVGKSSTCYHLAGTLARMGRRVLLIDNDPQASLTQGFWGPELTRDVPETASVAAAYDPDLEPLADALVRPTGIDGVAIVPGSRHLTRYNMMGLADWPRHHAGLRGLLADADAAGRFDLTLIDCPPNLHLCSWAALVASDALVVPVQAEDFGAQGLGPVQEAAAAVHAAVNPALHLAGYLVTMFDKRLGIHLAYDAMLREMYGPEVFAAAFPLAKDFKEAVAARQPISHYKPKSAAAKAARAVADELLERVAGAQAQDPGSRRVA